ncbi:MAG: hypothetical protein WCI21_01840 [Alphaproteobacteria bacterium]
MSTVLKLKKSEFLEIRIPYPTKQAFMARCRDDGRSASEALRGLIEDELSGRGGTAPIRSRKTRRLAMGALIVAILGAVALPSLARSNPDAEFRKLDANHDGMLSLAEYRQGAGPFSRITGSVQGR